MSRRIKAEPVDEVKSSSEETGDEGDQKSRYPRVQLTGKTYFTF